MILSYCGGASRPRATISLSLLTPFQESQTEYIAELLHTACSLLTSYPAVRSYL